jgi:hypothetical protein
MLFITVILAVLFVILIFVLTPLAQQMREQKAADTAATQQAARDQELQGAVFLVSIVLAVVAEPFVAALRAPLAQQMG